MAEKIIKMGVHESGSKECPMEFFYLAAAANVLDVRGLPMPADSLVDEAQWPGHYVVRNSKAQLVLGFPTGNSECLFAYATKLSEYLGGLVVDPTLYSVENEADFGLEVISWTPGFDPPSGVKGAA